MVRVCFRFSKRRIAHNLLRYLLTVEQGWGNEIFNVLNVMGPDLLLLGSILLALLAKEDNRMEEPFQLQ